MMEQDLYLHGLIKAVPVETPLWTRPTDWLTVPELELTDDKVQILYPIVPNTTRNFISFTCTGNYTVDWGDGNIENVASGVKAQHQYDWNDIDPLTLTSDGYLQVLVIITPNGGVLSTIDLNQVYTGGTKNLLTFEIVANIPSATSLTFTQYPNITRHIILGAHNITNFDSMFAALGLYRCECKGDMSNVTTMQDAFSGCDQLVEVVFRNPDFSSCTDFSFMFIGCSSLVNAPEMSFNPTLGTDINLYRMFWRCYSLTEVPLYNFLGVIYLDETFRDCRALTVVPHFNTQNITSMYKAFAECYALTSIPAFDTDACQSFYGMLQYTRVETIPAFDMSSVETAWAGGTDLLSGTIKTFNATGMRQTFTLANMILDKDNIVNVFTNLATVVGQTITITGNPGTASLTGADLLIATSKGWTVVT